MGRRSLLFSLAVIAFSSIWATADTVWIQSGSGNPIALSNVKVTGIEAESLLYTVGANQRSKPLAQVPQITLDDEPAFSTAEEAFRGGEFPAAVENYRKVLSTTGKVWLKERCALRLVQAADKSNNFAAAVTGFVELLQIKPALATDNKPAIPKQPTAIDQAVAALKQASQNPKLTADQKTVLGNYLVELYNAKGDSTSANATLGQITKAGADPGAATAESRRVAADLKLTEARQAYSQQQFSKAVQLLNASGALFTEPQMQADAVYLLAQATAASASSDPNQLKDAALGYMRVVAVCGGMPNKPHVAESLLDVAAIEEKLNNPKEALAVYNQIADEFKGTPVATTAKEAVARLTPAEKK